MTIHSGTANINGQMYGNVIVESAGTLGGNAIIKGGNLVNQGTVAPGNSIGLITVNGNYTQQSGAKLDIELSKPVDGVMLCDRLDVTGNATLASGSTIDVDRTQGSNAVFRNGDRFNIITAGGSITNGGVQVATHSSFLSFKTYNWTGPSIFGLQVAKSTTFASVVPDGNLKNIAAALDSDTDIAIDKFADVSNELLFMNSAEFASAVPCLSPGVYQAVNASERRTTQYLAESMSDWLQSRHRYACGCPAMQFSGITRLPQTGMPLADESQSPDKANIIMSRSLEEMEPPAVVPQPGTRRPAADSRPAVRHLFRRANQRPARGLPCRIDRRATCPGPRGNRRFCIRLGSGLCPHKHQFSRRQRRGRYEQYPRGPVSQPQL